MFHKVVRSKVLLWCQKSFFFWKISSQNTCCFLGVAILFKRAKQLLNKTGIGFLKLQEGIGPGNENFLVLISRFFFRAIGHNIFILIRGLSNGFSRPNGINILFFRDRSHFLLFHQQYNVNLCLLHLNFDYEKINFISLFHRYLMLSFFPSKMLNVFVNLQKFDTNYFFKLETLQVLNWTNHRM